MNTKTAPSSDKKFSKEFRRPTLTGRFPFGQDQVCGLPEPAPFPGAWPKNLMEEPKFKSSASKLRSTRLWKKRNKARVSEYRKKYSWGHRTEENINRRNWHMDNPHLSRWYSIKARARELGMPMMLTRSEFAEWYLKQKPICTYCDLVDLQFSGRLSNGKLPLFFSIDRKNSDLPYTTDNMCFACWTCNRLKSDFFTYDEWRDIGQRYVKAKWMAKLEAISAAH